MNMGWPLSQGEVDGHAGDRDLRRLDAPDHLGGDLPVTQNCSCLLRDAEAVCRCHQGMCTALQSAPCPLEDMDRFEGPPPSWWPVSEDPLQATEVIEPMSADHIADPHFDFGRTSCNRCASDRAFARASVRSCLKGQRGYKLAHRVRYQEQALVVCLGPKNWKSAQMEENPEFLDILWTTFLFTGQFASHAVAIHVYVSWPTGCCQSC